MTEPAVAPYGSHARRSSALTLALQEIMMKIQIFWIMAILATMVLPCFGGTNNWYHIWKGKTYVSEYALKPGEFQNFTIKTNKAITVSFQSDATQAHVKAYKKQPIKLEQLNPQNSSAYVTSCESVQGMGLEFAPVNGVIDMRISNSGTNVFRVVILTGTMEF